MNSIETFDESEYWESWVTSRGFIPITYEITEGVPVASKRWIVYPLQGVNAMSAN